MEAAFRKFLTDYYKNLMLDQAMKFLERYFTNELKFEDERKQRYRSDEDIEALEIEAKRQCETMTKELVDELEAEGIATSEEFIRQRMTAEKIQEKYLNELEKYLRGIK